MQKFPSDEVENQVDQLKRRVLRQEHMQQYGLRSCMRSGSCKTTYWPSNEEHPIQGSNKSQGTRRQVSIDVNIAPKTYIAFVLLLVAKHMKGKSLKPFIEGAKGIYTDASVRDWLSLACFFRFCIELVLAEIRCIVKGGLVL